MIKHYTNLRLLHFTYTVVQLTASQSQTEMFSAATQTVNRWDLLC